MNKDTPLLEAAHQLAATLGEPEHAWQLDGQLEGLHYGTTSVADAVAGYAQTLDSKAVDPHISARVEEASDLILAASAAFLKAGAAFRTLYAAHLDAAGSGARMPNWRFFISEPTPPALHYFPTVSTEELDVTGAQCHLCDGRDPYGSWWVIAGKPTCGNCTNIAERVADAGGEPLHVGQVLSIGQQDALREDETNRRPTEPTAATPPRLAVPSVTLLNNTAITGLVRKAATPEQAAAILSQLSYGDLKRVARRFGVTSSDTPHFKALLS